jgi:hypothetical protein
MNPCLPYVTAGKSAGSDPGTLILKTVEEIRNQFRETEASFAGKMTD